MGQAQIRAAVCLGEQRIRQAGLSALCWRLPGDSRGGEETTTKRGTNLTLLAPNVYVLALCFREMVPCLLPGGGGENGGDLLDFGVNKEEERRRRRRRGGQNKTSLYVAS